MGVPNRRRVFVPRWPSLLLHVTRGSCGPTVVLSADTQSEFLCSIPSSNLFQVGFVAIQLSLFSRRTQLGAEALECTLCGGTSVSLLIVRVCVRPARSASALLQLNDCGCHATLACRALQHTTGCQLRMLLLIH